MPFSLSVHDELPADETAIVDAGLGEANDAAAPLHEVRPLSCFARDATGRVVGGAVGRRWGGCCELRQLWVRPELRRRGLGSDLVRRFEARAQEHGCSVFYLETFDFQAPGFYQALGYATAYEHKVYPHGISRCTMVKACPRQAPDVAPGPPRPASAPQARREGGCQCGAVRYRIAGAPVMTALCHCSMCRRAHAAPAVAWALYDESQVEFTAGERSFHASSDGCRRGFCPRCGSQISFSADYIPGRIDLAIGSLDDPDGLPPSLHCWDSRRLPWLHLADGWPRFPEFPPAPA